MCCVLFVLCVAYRIACVALLCASWALCMLCCALFRIACVVCLVRVALFRDFVASVVCSVCRACVRECAFCV